MAGLRRDHRTVTARLCRDRHLEQDRRQYARTQASDRVLVEVLAATDRYGTPLPSSGLRANPVAVALSAPYVTTLAAEHYTPNLADTMRQAAARIKRAYVQIAERLPAHPPPPRAVVVVEDAAAADPAQLSAVATALVSTRGRLLLIDSGQPGTARPLLDGLALPWSETDCPTIDIDDPALAAARTVTATRPLAAGASSPLHSDPAIAAVSAIGTKDWTLTDAIQLLTTAGLMFMEAEGSPVAGDPPTLYRQ